MSTPESQSIPEMSLEEYVAHEHSLVLQFVEWWKKNHEANPEHFPMTMPIGHWDEQFHFFDPSDSSVWEKSKLA